MKNTIKIILLLILQSCSLFSSSSIKKVKHSNIKSIFNKPLNLVFFWTTWCGTSKSVLKETYSKLQNDSDQYNIILICGNNAPETIEEYYNVTGIRLEKYTLGNSSNIFPMLDRRNIKKFIEQELKNTGQVRLEGNFGVPVSLLIDSSLSVIKANMPQDLAGIRYEISRYKSMAPANKNINQ